MTHTAHPYSLRLGIVRNWKSRWLNVKKYKSFLRGDVLLKDWLRKKMRGFYVDAIEIERSPDILKIIIKTSRPGLVIGRRGEGAENLKKEIEKFLIKNDLQAHRRTEVAIEEVRKPETHAAIVAQMIAENLEKRLPFRRVIKQAVDKVLANKEAKGVKVALSGRLGGAEMSRREWLGKGKMPLQTLCADIDFARERAHLPYGDIGIKVWIFRENNE